MKLIEALEIIGKPAAADSPRFGAWLTCSFTPAHLQTFLYAHLKLARPRHSVEVSTGLYGDLWGNLEMADAQNPDVFIVPLEWSDFDQRLGMRSLGTWSPKDLEDILVVAKSRASQLLGWLERASLRVPCVLSFPTLPLPPVAYTPGWRASGFELELRACLASLSQEASRFHSVSIVNAQRLNMLSPLAMRHDIRAELSSGFPYKTPHASELAALLARLAAPPAPRKGLITDLDDTLWKGILGEIGVDGVSWDLEHDGHLHGIYQRFLHSLAESGVLIAVASKNDPKTVQQAMVRSDLILPAQSVFPVEANWGPKSESVARILKAWNIGADAVVFVDDSPMELAEVRNSFPDMETLLFPKEDAKAIEALLLNLRDQFGRSALNEEDAIRRESLRRSQQLEERGITTGTVSDEFLKQAEAEITLSFVKDPPDPRAFELVNKTNQFNLNGRRYAEKEWHDFLQDPKSILLIVSYKDKYGPLGKIAVLGGRLEGKRLSVNLWVMSCRAFSRRIEHRSLEELFNRFTLDEIVFDFSPTPKNGPTLEFLTGFLGRAPESQSVLSRAMFFEGTKPTFHHVLELTRG